jgi:hypothetical protein
MLKSTSQEADHETHPPRAQLGRGGLASTYMSRTRPPATGRPQLTWVARTSSDNR